MIDKRKAESIVKMMLGINYRHGIWEDRTLSTTLMRPATNYEVIVSDLRNYRQFFVNREDETVEESDNDGVFHIYRVTGLKQFEEIGTWNVNDFKTTEVMR